MNTKLLRSSTDFNLAIYQNIIINIIEFFLIVLRFFLLQLNFHNVIMCFSADINIIRFFAHIMKFYLHRRVNRIIYFAFNRI